MVHAGGVALSAVHCGCKSISLPRRPFRGRDVSFWQLEDPCSGQGSLGWLDYNTTLTNSNEPVNTSTSCTKSWKA